jgi:predicted RNase H-like HicB family nuclease
MHDIDTSPLRPEELREAQRYALIIEWYPADSKYLATAPDLPGLIVSGRTRAEAAEMGEEAIAVWISANRQVGEAVPDPGFTALPAYLRPAPDLAGAGARE